MPRIWAKPAGPPVQEKAGILPICSKSKSPRDRFHGTAVNRAGACTAAKRRHNNG